jgi:hypothetical protein
MMLVAVVDAEDGSDEDLRVGRLAAVVAADESTEGPEALLRHAERVHEAFVRHPALVPARARTVVAPDALREWLGTHQDQLGTLLDLVRGRCELALTWTGAGEPPEQAATGTAYLEGLRRQWGPVELAERGLAALSADPQVADVRVLARSPRRLAVSALVARDGAAELLDRGASLLPRSDGWRWSGPYPPYSFVGTTS